jgi:L-iditol 2-dehydrogenase
MKAVVKYALGPGNVELRDVSEPTPGPGDVKVEVKAAGVCG